MNSNTIQTLIGTCRPKFLTLTPVAIALGVSVAVWQGFEIDLVTLILLFIGAIASHISVNTFNEYYDFKSGLDLITERTPFSGGSGSLVSDPQALTAVRALAFITLALVIAIGLYFIAIVGWKLLPLGIMGILLVVLYTPWINQRPIVCLIAPGLGFGAMVVGSHFVVAGQYTGASLAVSLVVVFLVSDLLLLNQFPDIEADRSVGRHHLPITIGRKQSSKVFALFLLATYVVILALYLADSLPLLGLVAFITALVAIPLGKAVIEHAEDTAELMPYFGLNVLLVHLIPLLLAITYFLSPNQ